MPFVEYDEVEAVCSDCGRIFRSDEALAAHRTDAHLPGGEDPPARHRVGCSVCGRSFVSVGALAAHNRTDHTS